ncbi:synaptotagmin-like 5, partial [Cichlidogyrus casuarinus]
PDSGYGQDPSMNESPLKRIEKVVEEDGKLAVKKSSTSTMPSIKMLKNRDRPNNRSIENEDAASTLGIRKFGSQLSVAGTSMCAMRAFSVTQISRRNSETSLNSDIEDSNSRVTVTGQLELIIDYLARHEQLRIVVNRAIGLAKVGEDLPNSYVKCYLLPDKSRAGKRKTKAKKGTADPEFKEQFIYKIPATEMRSRELALSVWHRQTVTGNVFLGEMHINLTKFKFDPAPKTYPLRPKKEKVPLVQTLQANSIQPTNGELVLALKFETSKGEEEHRGDLSVWIKNAVNLCTNSESPNAYVKVYLMPEKSAELKRKTKTVKNQVSPSWNTVFVYENLATSELSVHGLEIIVMNQGKFKSTELIGGLRINNGSR